MTAEPAIQPPASASASASAASGEESATQVLDHSLEQCLATLLEMGICASDVQERALESANSGPAHGYPAGLMGIKTAQTVQHLSTIYNLKDSVTDIHVPLQVISSVDNGKNPHSYTRDFVERLAGENMYTNGILSAVTDYRDLLYAELSQAFPDLAQYLVKDDMNGTTTEEEQQQEDAAHVMQEG
ncbi:hypothetical protein T439DRAFT_322634 [Meredithblackwellia eburnea MCA 4105]